MTATGRATVTIDDAALKARMRGLLAQAWDEGWDEAILHANECRYVDCHNQPANPYRDEADE